MADIEEAAKSFHKAMKGIGKDLFWNSGSGIVVINFLILGTDESRIIKEIVKHSNGNRQIIKAKYLTMFGKVSIQGYRSMIEPLIGQ